MNNIVERRSTMRMAVNCEIYCKLQDTEKLHKALCVTLSGGGISFISEQAFEIDTNVEINILTDTALTPASRFFITIVRCEALENGNFDIGAIIQLANETD
jgi:c-di-GMP-binding flagellar brake protein YcgR